jgi:hypothetical protein
MQGRDEVLVRREPSQDGARKRATRMEIWSIPPKAAPEREVGLPIEFSDFMPSRARYTDGLIAWEFEDDEKKRFVRVFSETTGKFKVEDPLFDSQTSAQGPQDNEPWVNLKTRDGTGLAVASHAVYGLDDGRRIWGWGTELGELPIGLDLGGSGKIEFYDSFERVAPLRIWNDWAKTLAPGFQFQWACARVCDLQSGRMLYRCEEPSLPNVTGNYGPVVYGDLHVTLNGRVTRIDPTPRWSLIALLQAILAAPLVAVWGLLRWRRWRLAKAAT